MQTEIRFEDADAREWNWPVFLALTFVQMWAAHAWVFFAHEYAHSLTAWILGLRVPVRTFTTEGDMGSVERGLGWSPWMVLLVFGIPTLIVLVDFLLRVEPSSIRWLLPWSVRKRGLLAVLTAFALFGFYAAAGWMEGGPISHRLSVISVCMLFPLVAVVEGILVSRRAPDTIRSAGA